VADQARWFKLWCSAPADDDLQTLPPALRWAWVAFGAYTKLHGTHGRVTIHSTNGALAAEMGVTVEVLIDTLSLLPHMRVEPVQNRHGEFTVTWDNWVKYQEDSTQAERARTSRSKKRREEKRKELPPLPPQPRGNLSADGNRTQLGKAIVEDILAGRLTREQGNLKLQRLGLTAP